MKKLLVIFLVLGLNINFFPQENNFIKLAEDLQFPEGPAWNGKGSLFVSSCYGGFITKISGGNAEVFIDSTQKPFRLKQTNGLTFGKDGYLYACDYGIGAILKISEEGNTEILAAGYNGEKFNRPNDLAFDPEGKLYFTDPKSYGADKPDGRIFMIEKDSKEVKLIEDNLHFPNGIAFSKEAKNLFVAESALNRILKYDVNEDGSLSNKKVFCELPGGDPDGLAFDKEGNLYAAHFGSGNIFIISKDGEIKDSIKAPGKKPSNVEFGGDDMRTLFITEDETNSVYKAVIEVPGVYLFNSPR